MPAARSPTPPSLPAPSLAAPALTGPDTSAHPAGHTARSSAGAPIGRTAQTLPAQVAARILEAIFAGEFQPGQRLTEIALATTHQVSRSVIREALVLLDRQRIVERLPRLGARVVAISIENVVELFEVRAALLGVAARRAATSASDAALAGFDSQVAAIESLAARPRCAASVYADQSIALQHQVLDMSGGRWLEDLYSQLSNLALWRAVVRDRSVSFDTAARRQSSASDWRRIADALARRDPVASENAARALLQASGDYVRSRLAPRPDPGGARARG